MNIKKTFFFLLISGMLSSFTYASNYEGIVYVDANQNQQFDQGEKKLSSVEVTDGLNIVQTDSKGHFQLPGHEKARFIYITTPSGYKTFNAYYQKIEANKTTYNFGVIPYKGALTSKGAHRFIQISDTEISDTYEQDEWANNVRDYAINNPVDFVIQTGDICYEGGLKSHIKLMNTANMHTQMFYCIGNHDLVKGKYGEELFEKLYGPTWYSFNVGSVHYIVTPMLHGDYRPSYTVEEVVAWMRNDLAQIKKGTPIIVFNHDLWTKGENFLVKSKIGNLDLDTHNLKAFIYGHWHINYVHQHRTAKSICTSTMVRGGIDHSTAGFRIYNVDPLGNFKMDFKYTYNRRLLVINSIQHGEAANTINGKAPLSISVYSTVTDVQSVKYACYFNQKRIISNQPLHQNTDFNWMTKMPIPKKYAGKNLTVKVWASLKNGEVLQAQESWVYHYKPTKEIELQSDWKNLMSSPQHKAPQIKECGDSLHLAWVQNAGSNIYMTSPIVYNKKVYTATIDQRFEGKAAVVCMDGKTGDIIWKYAVHNSIKNTIAATSGLIFAQDVEGKLYALDSETGNLSWQYKLKLALLPALNDGLITTDSKVFAGTGKGLTAFDAKSGKVLWTNKDWRMGEGCTATLSEGNGVIVGNAHWGALYGNDEKTGKEIWRAKTDALRNRSASAVIDGNVFYLISKNAFFVMETKTGKILVKKDLGYNVDVTSSPLVTDKEIIFGTATRGIVALDKNSLEEKWNCRTSPSIIYTSPYVTIPSSTVETSPIACGKYVIVGSSDGALNLLERETGKEIWRFQTGSPILNSPAISGNMLFIGDFSGNIYAFRK